MNGILQAASSIVVAEPFGDGVVGVSDEDRLVSNMAVSVDSARTGRRRDRRGQGCNALTRVGEQTTESIRFSTFDAFDGTVAERLDSMFDPTLSLSD